MNDKTNWRKMLSGSNDPIDLKKVSEQSEELLPDGVEFDFCDMDPLEITYPVDQYPTKIKSVSLDKVPEVKGMLKGIKGQYLIFEEFVFNWRKHQGYVIDLQV